MFSKTLILVLLGASLTLARPVSNSVSAALTDKVSETWKSIETAANDILDKLKLNFEQVLEEVKKRHGHAGEISREKHDQLKKDYEDLQKTISSDIHNQQEIWVDRLKQAMDLGRSTIRGATEKVKKVKEDAVKAIRERVHKWQEAYDKWLDDVKDALK